MNRNNPILVKSRGGEFLYPGLNAYMKKRYKADTPLDNAVVPYIVMLLCAVVDAAVFISLFKMISYDSPFMLGIQVVGFLFAFDVVPIYLGIQLRRVRQHLTRDRLPLYMALGVCAVAVILNVLLNVMTVDLMNPDLSSATTSYFGTMVEQPSKTGVDPATIALTIFRIGCPVLTSVGSFFISYATYHPLLVRQRNLEEALAEKDDEIRRIGEALSEYKALREHFLKMLMEDDTGKFVEKKKMHFAKALSYCAYVRQRLKEHLANPTAHNALSVENCTALLERLDRETAAMERIMMQEESSNQVETPVENKPIINDVAA